MNYKLKTNSVILLFKEESYAEPISDYNSITPYVIADFMQPATSKTESIEIKTSTYSRQPLAKNFLAGRKKAELTIKGALSDSHSFLLKAFTGTNSFPHTISNESELNSYEIHQLFKDGTVNIAKGCVCEKLTITGESGGYIAYETNFRCQWEDKEINTSALTNYPSWIEATSLLSENSPFNFCDTNVIKLFGENATSYKNFNNFELNLENIFADDSVLFANSSEKKYEISTGMKGEFKAEMNYNPTIKITKEDLAKYPKGVASFKLKKNGVSWLFNIKGVLNETTFPDCEKDIYKLAGTINLAKHNKYGNCLVVSRTTM